MLSIVKPLTVFVNNVKIREAMATALYKVKILI
ncbi:hypothetical protein QE439_002680 [Pedobacter agri]|nr:hypothetical protein [Pedobacter agri]